MTPFGYFALRHRRTLALIFILSSAFTFGLALTGCGAPAWLSDAGSIIAMVGSSFTSIASFVAGLTGNAALAALLTTVTAWITKVQTGISDLQLLITQYKQSPSTSLLAEIEAALADVKTNVATDFSNLGLPASVLSVIVGIANLAGNLLAEWDAAILGVKTATSSAELKTAVEHISTLADSLPVSMAKYQSAVNQILDTPTGDPEIDAALAKAVRV